MDEDIFSLKNKVILVTGALGLIGKEISNSFLRKSAKVILAGHSKNKIETYRSKLSKKYSADDYLLCQLEITDEKSIQKTIEESVSKFGRIDVLVNNAAIDAKFDELNKSKIDMSRFENYPFDLIKKSIDVNMLGTIQITQNVCKQMLIQGEGSIINVASSYALVSPNQNLYDYQDGEIRFKPIDYVASKSFMINFTRYVATFYAKENIRCNAIAPHGIQNDHNKEFLKNFERLSPIGRMCNVEELNGPFILLASNASSYMTGAILVVDGGWSAW
jgi:NAD(P)-dependent dehydrogenase (short-subunit alcohol dehydrogenase family)